MKEARIHHLRQPKATGTNTPPLYTIYEGLLQDQEKSLVLSLSLAAVMEYLNKADPSFRREHKRHLKLLMRSSFGEFYASQMKAIQEARSLLQDHLGAQQSSQEAPPTAPQARPHSGPTRN